MRRAFMITVVCGVAVSTAAEAQYYRRYYEPPPDAITRVTPDDPGYNPRRPRVDPRNGGTYCVQEGYTVQNGICKPYTGR